MRYRAMCAVFLIAAGLLSVLAGPGMAEPLLAQNQANAAVETAINLPHRLSPLTMFAAADWVVKAVIIGLLLLSALSWVIFIAKSLELAARRRQAQAVLKAVAQAPDLDSAVSAAAGRKGAALLLVLAAAEEVETSQKAVLGAGNAGLKERVASVLTAIQLQARRKAAKNIGIIATIGSVAPFIGLFGTVWGIMNAFIGIAESQTTGLSAVAPGIAEALLATAIGLFAAIPATIIYNIFVRSITLYRHILADIAAALERLVSRDLDFAAARITAENISASGR